MRTRSVSRHSNSAEPDRAAPTGEPEPKRTDAPLDCAEGEHLNDCKAKNGKSNSKSAIKRTQPPSKEGVPGAHCERKAVSDDEDVLPQHVVEEVVRRTSEQVGVRKKAVDIRKLSESRAPLSGGKKRKSKPVIVDKGPVKVQVLKPMEETVSESASNFLAERLYKSRDRSHSMLTGRHKNMPAPKFA
mmetsp:Transcript_9935/g.23715  ORF Transcript_9935/g.23715 Transcript_9935/m.23715 type:complete len:187 (+) Transcript_9935:125-685(+)